MLRKTPAIREPLLLPNAATMGLGGTWAFVAAAMLASRIGTPVDGQRRGDY